MVPCLFKTSSLCGSPSDTSDLDYFESGVPEATVLKREAVGGLSPMKYSNNSVCPMTSHFSWCTLIGNALYSELKNKTVSCIWNNKIEPPSPQVIHLSAQFNI